ncbi:MAG: hypothetical protein WBA93_27430 [Microcoleaceae cyanobacterium]
MFSQTQSIAFLALGEIHKFEIFGNSSVRQQTIGNRKNGIAHYGMMVPKIGLDHGRKKQGMLIILAIPQIPNPKSQIPNHSSLYNAEKILYFIKDENRYKTNQQAIISN